MTMSGCLEVEPQKLGLKQLNQTLTSGPGINLLHTTLDWSNFKKIDQGLMWLFAIYHQHVPGRDTVIDMK